MIIVHDIDLEQALRTLSASSGHSLTTLARALIRLGLKAKPAVIAAEALACMRPKGRPVEVPQIKESKKEEKTNKHGWDGL